MPATNIRLAEDHSDGGIPLGEPLIDSQSDSEDDNAERRDGLSGVAESDRLVLQEEEERERLLGIDHGYEKPKGFSNTGSRDGKGARNGPQDPRKQLGRLKKNRKARRTGKRHEKGELLYEMEEGGLRDNISSHSSSSSLELERLKGEPSRTLRVGQCISIVELSSY